MKTFCWLSAVETKKWPPAALPFSRRSKVKPPSGRQPAGCGVSPAYRQSCCLCCFQMRTCPCAGSTSAPTSCARVPCWGRRSPSSTAAASTARAGGWAAPSAPAPTQVSVALQPPQVGCGTLTAICLSAEEYASLCSSYSAAAFPGSFPDSGRPETGPGRGGTIRWWPHQAVQRLPPADWLFLQTAVANRGGCGGDRSAQIIWLIANRLNMKTVLINI